MAARTPKKQGTQSDLPQDKNGEIARLNQEFKKFHLAVENASNHIIITDPDGKVIYANRAVEEITGYAIHEVLGKKAGALWGKQMGTRFYKELWKTIKKEKKVFRGEIVNKRKNGEIYYAHMTISPVLDQNRDILFFVGAEFDITEAKESERKLKEYAHRLEEGKARDDALLLSIADGILVTDTAGTITFVNQAFEKLCGMDSHDILGHDLDETIPLYFINGQRVPKEERPLYIGLVSAIQKRAPIFDTETCYVLNQVTGRRIPLSISAAPFFMYGEVQGAVAVWRDITEVIETDKAKSEFISFASHQLRTPLTSVRLAIDILLHPQEEELTSEQKKYLKIALSGINEMAELIENLLSISRIQMGTMAVNLEPIHLAKFLDKILEGASLPLKEKHMKVKRLYANDIPSINLDPQLMKMSLENLISNALKYGPLKSTVTVEIQKKGEDAIVSVSDTGSGIPKDQQSKIFERLFRVHTDSAVKGTGLGLYMAKRAVDRYGGRIWCESPSPKAFRYSKDATGGQGATFYVTVPLKGMRAQKRKT